MDSDSTNEMALLQILGQSYAWLGKGFLAMTPKLSNNSNKE
jgi:hypothetical protein